MRSTPPTPKWSARHGVLRRAIPSALAATLAVTTLAAPAVANSAQPKPDGPVMVAYVDTEVHSDLSFVTDHRLESSSAPVFDVAILDSAIMGYDGERATLEIPDRLSAVLADASAQIDPLQDSGLQVTLLLTGGLEGAGFANFPDAAAAQAYATEVAAFVKDAGLDGVDLREEGTDFSAGPASAARSWRSWRP